MATPAEGASAAKLKRVAFGDGATEHLENWVDAMDEALPALSSFILPSGEIQHYYSNRRTTT